MPAPTGQERLVEPRLAEAYDYCAGLLRENDRNRFLAGLFVAAAQRRHLAALYAFSAEVARIREAASQPAAGEIRLQWWREAFAGTARGDVAAHPVALALLDTVDRFRLPRQAFLALLDARTFDLYDDPMPTVADLEGYCGETSSALMRLASLVLAGGEECGGAEAAGHAGVAYAITGLLRAFPWHAGRGQLYVPADILARHGVARAEIVAGRDSLGLRAALADMRDLARHHLERFEDQCASLSRDVAAAFLPVTLVPLYLRRIARGDYDPFRTIVEVPQWQRQWALWRAARRMR